MANSLKKIIPVIIVTTLMAGGVVTFYRSDFTGSMTKSPEPESDDNTTNIAEPLSAAKKKQPDYQAILTRNFFGPSAEEITPSMVADEPVAPVTLETTTLEVSLLGTITGSSQNRRAILLDKKKKVQDIYFQGDMIQDALIKEIQREQIILTRNGNDELLVQETSKTNPALPTQPAPLSPEPPETIPEPPPEPPPEETIESEPEHVEPVVEPVEP